MHQITESRKSSHDTGAASEFLVLSILFRLGVNAFISFGNKKSIDIAIQAKNGLALSVDVKSVRGYSSIVVNNVKPAANHFIVVVIYNNKFEDLASLPDFYIIPSDRIAGVTSTFSKEKRLMKGDIENFKNQWGPLKV